MIPNIVSIHQPNFIPWLGFFYKIKKSDIFVFLDNVQFSKNSYQNRVKIKSSQGAIWLTVPVMQSFGQLTQDVKINNKEPWREKHLKTIEMNYKRSKYFKPVYELLNQVYYKKEWDLLTELNIEFINKISQYLSIETKTIRSSSLNVDGKSTDLLINIIKELHCSTYFSGKGAVNYQDENKYKENDITLVYTNFRHPVYPQLWNEFVEGLSIIDMLFNNDISQIRNFGET